MDQYIVTLLHCCIAETSLWEISWRWIYPKFSHVVGVERVWMLNLAKWWRNDKTRGVPWNWKLLKQMLERSEMLFEQICQNLLNILVDRLHPVGGWQILWVEAVGRLGWLVAWKRERLERPGGWFQGIDPGLTRLNSLPQWWQGADGQWSSYPCVSTLSIPFNCFTSILLCFSCHVSHPQPQSWTESGLKLIVWSGEHWIKRTAEL